MEAVLKNVASAVELLAVAAHSDAVSQWDEQTLSRAFQWAGYCEHVYTRFHTNSAIRRVVEKQLQHTNATLRDAFADYNEVSFMDLPRCEHLLLRALLNNPQLPISTIRILFGLKNGTSRRYHYQEVTGLCSHLIQCKSACEVLRPFSGLSAVSAEAEVQGEMLMKRLGALLSQGSDPSQAEHFLHSSLLLCEGAARHSCLVITAALLTASDSAGQTSSQSFLLDWLQKEHGVLQHMGSTLPSAVLKDLAGAHRKFRDAYFGALKKWASEMEYSLSDGEWVPACTAAPPALSFPKMVEHFSDLFDACPSLRRNAEDELLHLKILDGDFDARGLSVWGDILSEVKK